MRLWDLRFRGRGLRLRVWGLRLRVRGLRVRVVVEILRSARLWDCISSFVPKGGQGDALG